MRKAGCSVSEFWIRTRLRGQPGDFWCHCMMSVLLIVFSWNGTSLQLDNKRHGPANYEAPHPARPCYRILGVSTHHQTPTQLTCSLLFSPNIDFTFSVKLLFVEVCLFSFCWFFFRRRVLELSDGIDSPNGVKTDLALCLLVAWVIVYLCIMKGIKSSGKVSDFS